jgi:uncharacterized membrane protein
MESKHEGGESRSVVTNYNNTPVQENEQFLAVQYSGILPPANELIRYNEAHPDAANRIIKMAEEQEAHRHSLEKQVVRWGNIKSFLGLMFAFLLAIGTIGIGGFLIYSDKSGYGFAVIISALATLLAAFLYGKKQAQEDLQDLQEKQEEDES